MAIKAQNQVTILDITDAYSVVLSNESQTFMETAEDSGTAAQNATTTVYSFRGSTNVYAAVINDITDANGVKVNKNRTKAQDLVLTINIPSGLKASGSIDIPIVLYENNSPATAAATDTDSLVTITKTFSYSVARFGQTGSGGVSPTIYSLECDNTLFNFSNTNKAFTVPSTITVTASSKTGNSTPTTYSEGTITVTGHKSTGNPITIGSNNSSVTITPHVTDGEPTYLYYKATLTVGSTVVDTQTIGITRDGANGQNAYNIDITSTQGFIFKNSAIATALTAHVYSGGTELQSSDLASLSIGVKWYLNGTVIPASSTSLSNNGLTYTIEAGDITDRADIIAKLEDITQGS